MKTLYLNIILFITFTGMLSCKAQQNSLPLNTWMENIPSGGYVKDLDNELSPYVGIYKAVYQGNEIVLFVTKEENRSTKRGGKQFYRDALVIKYIAKNQNNQVLQDTQNVNNPNLYIYSYKTQATKNRIIFVYSGTNCGVGWGDIYLKKINNTQISWTYQADSTVTTDQNCPGNPDLTVYLPETENLIFTKQ
ncbi:hypothetical protein [Chryseobacterium viscerum]|uniref:Lipocalin-like domain-containing protein n=1 Tax=Chryseobacterium viscerum TaxID=1037377 RepID=A0A5N4BN18_9FLAO|nr:hypothetical protein [Chryseobacterium viscerum]KAB1229803.1 hypothetical protein F8D52_16150 [Chryseobacterium viscerum]